jgi:hypothetical protein
LRGWKSSLPLPAPPAVAAVRPPSLVVDRPIAVARGRNDRPRARITARGSEWRVPSVPSIPGDGGWLSWLPREHSRTGVEGIDPIPGVIHSPGRAGNLVAFPVRNYLHGAWSSVGSGNLPRSSPVTVPSPGAPETHHPVPPPTTSTDRSREPSESLPRTRPMSVEELDRMFPPVSGPRSVFLADAPEKVGGPSPWVRELSLPADPPASREEPPQPPYGRPPSVEEDEDPPSQTDGFAGRRTEPARNREAATPPRPASSGGFSRPDPPTADLLREATNPVPPHLRETGRPSRSGARGSSGRPTDLADGRSVCASCSKVVVNVRMSSDCPKCLRPICDDCLREAFVTHGHGWCADCAAPPTVGIS